MKIIAHINREELIDILVSLTYAKAYSDALITDKIRIKNLIKRLELFLSANNENFIIEEIEKPD